MTVIWQVIQAIWAGIKIGFQAIFSAFSIVDALNDIQDQIWALLLNVPVTFITIAGLAYFCFNLYRKFN